MWKNFKKTFASSDLNSKIKISIKYAQAVARNFGDIANHFPNKNDGKVAKILKIAGFFGKVYDTVTSMDMADIESVFDSVFAQSNDLLFANVFWNSPVKDEFDIKHSLAGDKWHIIIQADNKEIGTAYFLTYLRSDQSRMQIERTFWHSHDFNFDKFYELLWEKLGDKITAGSSEQSEINRAARKGNRLFSKSRKIDIEDGLNFSSAPAVSDPIVGKSAIILDELCLSFERFRKNSIPRAYLLVGKPGTGKSTFAMHFAEKIYGRILKMNAPDFVDADYQMIRGIFEQIKPDFLVVDDIDKAMKLNEHLAILLNSITDLKSEVTRTTIMFTANDVSRLDSSFVRPGRIDEILEFELPDNEDRIQLMNEYTKVFSKKFDVPEGYKIEIVDKFSPIVKETEGLSHAHVKEVALRRCYLNPDEVMVLVQKMKKINDMVN